MYVVRVWVHKKVDSHLTVNLLSFYLVQQW